jgi:hypothetical protein
MRTGGSDRDRMCSVCAATLPGVALVMLAGVILVIPVLVVGALVGLPVLLVRFVVRHISDRRDDRRESVAAAAYTPPATRSTAPVA